MKIKMKLYVCRVSDLITEQTQTQLYGLLPQFRRDAADACKNETDRKRSLAASCLLYYCMKEQGVPISATPCFSPSGKMYFPQVNRFYVNLSHAKDYAVCACDEEEIGVDVEGIRPYRKSVIQRIGTEEEIIFFRELDEQNKISDKAFETDSLKTENSDAETKRKKEQKGIKKEQKERKKIDEEFTKLWTRKESAVKLTGQGISALLEPSGEDKRVFTKTFQPFADAFLSVSSFSDRFCQEITEISAVSMLDFLKK